VREKGIKEKGRGGESRQNANSQGESYAVSRFLISD
jgi:hypothetical protein